MKTKHIAILFGGSQILCLFVFWWVFLYEKDAQNENNAQTVLEQFPYITQIAEYVKKNANTIENGQYLMESASGNVYALYGGNGELKSIGFSAYGSESWFLSLDQASTFDYNLFDGAYSFRYKTDEVALLAQTAEKRLKEWELNPPQKFLTLEESHDEVSSLVKEIWQKAKENKSRDYSQQKKGLSFYADKDIGHGHIFYKDVDLYVNQGRPGRYALFNLVKDGKEHKVPVTRENLLKYFGEILE